jgi:hypothetical protein
MEKEVDNKEGGRVNLGRHQAQCSICKSLVREQIEEDWLNWKSPSHIVENYKNLSRDALYRHVRALGLNDKRRKNYSVALERIIESVDYIHAIRCSDVISAVKALAKLNGLGQKGKPVQGADLRKLLARMSHEEREHFVKDGTLPKWFPAAMGTTPDEGQEEEKPSEVTEAEKVK